MDQGSSDEIRLLHRRSWYAPCTDRRCVVNSDHRGEHGVKRTEEVTSTRRERRQRKKSSYCKKTRRAVILNRKFSESLG